MFLQDFNEVDLLDDLQLFTNVIALVKGGGIADAEVGEAAGESHGGLWLRFGLRLLLER